MKLLSGGDALPAMRTVLTRGTELVPQLSRYSTASVVALATDLSAYTMLCALSVKAPLAGVVGYSIGMIVHYALSSKFVFEGSGSQKAASRRFMEFAASGLLGMLFTWAMIDLLTGYFAVSAILAKGTAVVISFLAVFFIRRRIVFASAFDVGVSGADFVYSKSGSCR
jgi:putative flippase GtrA